MPDKNMIIFLGAVSVAAIFWVIVYDLFLRRWLKRMWGKLARRGHKHHHRY